MKRRWIIVSVFVIMGVLIYAGLFLSKENTTRMVSQETERNPANTNVVIRLESPDTIYKIGPDSRRLLYGRDDSILRVIAFVDFSSVSSVNAIKTLKEVASGFGDLSVYLYSFPVFKNDLSIPLSNLFIESVNRGKIREFVDYIIKQDSMNAESIKDYLKANNLKEEDIFIEYGEGDLSKLPAVKDMNLGVNFGVNIPPTFFINGLRVDGFKDEGQLRDILDIQYKKAKELLDKGIDRKSVYDEIIKDGKETAYIVKVVDRKIGISDNSATATNDLANIYEEDLRYVPLKGPRFAPVTLVVFLDYECPYSKRYYAVIKSAIEKYGNDIRVFIKHSPLSTHKKSIDVAKYLAASLGQKKFWPLFDKIMTHPDYADDSTILRFATELEMDIEKLKNMKDSSQIEKYVSMDMDKGLELKIKTLPTTYINGVRYEGVLSTARLMNIIQIEKVSADKLLEEGIKMEELYDNLVRRNRIKNLVNIEKNIKKPYMEKVK